MRAKPSLDKVCWQWADTTYPENVTPENVRRLKLHVCEMGSFERQCKGNLNCIICIGMHLILFV
ncbi:hypothetical protein DPMN_017207 [Dreissena polymorpha]|uniref:Uncharacterized protein n=1 Tax=Dreissena polymorpha TaxID=45954 RepID=A0A9D4NH22_DREPO|nr:hypothetical protein DPMN_017207 [Dreissena polymorpha]